MRRTPSMALVAAALVAAATADLAPPAPSALADDAGAAIRTEQHLCRKAYRPPERFLACVAIYRNASDRPVFDIAIGAAVGGQQLLFMDSSCPVQTRTALAPGERGAFVGTLVLPDGVSEHDPVALAYRASSTGDPRALDVPRPEVQYIERKASLGQVVYRVETRNADGQPWRGLEPGTLAGVACNGAQPALLIALERGRIVDWSDRVVRWPQGAIAADGRAWYQHAVPTYTPSDEAHIFFREAFRPDDGTPAEARWELAGLDTWLAWEDFEPGERPWYLKFQATVRNPSAMTLHGDVYVIPRRADFHAIGGVHCPIGFVAPGATAVCRDRLDLRSGYTPDDVRFTTVELGLPTACWPPAVPIGGMVDPAPIANAVGRVWLPWLGAFGLGACP